MLAAGEAGGAETPAPEREPAPEPPIPAAPQAAIETVAWDYLYDLHCGGENNDGAYGTFVFDVPARTLTLEHNERYTEVNTTSHEF